MPIIKEVTAPNGVLVSYHKVGTCLIDYARALATIRVLSWSDQERHDQNLGLAWNWEIDVALNLISQYSQDELLVMTEPFTGGGIVNDNTIGLEGAKLKKWLQVKQLRQQSIDTDLITPYGVFQCASDERQNITDAVQMATVLTAMEQPVSISWTLRDNSVVVLNAEQMTHVGLLLGQKIQEAHAIARVRRGETYAATSIEELNILSWSMA